MRSGSGFRVVPVLVLGIVLSKAGCDSSTGPADGHPTPDIRLSIDFEASYQDVTYGPFAYQYMTPERYMAPGEGLGMSLAELLFGLAS